MAAAFHIYDEPPTLLDDPNDHNIHEFNDSLKFLGFPNINISAPAKVNRKVLPKPVGILGWEIAALDFRNNVGAINHVDAMRVDGAAGDPLGGGGGTQVCGGVDGMVVA